MEVLVCVYIKVNGIWRKYWEKEIPQKTTMKQALSIIHDLIDAIREGLAKRSLR